MGYYAKIQAMGDFNVGDRVRIKMQYRGKTWSSKQKRSGEWILKEFKTTNWVLKRPADYTGYHKQGLLAKSHMLEKVEPKLGLADKSIAAAKQSPTGLTPKDPPLQSVPVTKQKISVENYTPIHVMTQNAKGTFEWTATDEQMKVLLAGEPTIKQMPSDYWAPKPPQPKGGDLKKDIITLRPGTVVLVKDPESPGKYKGLWAVIEHSHTGLKYVSVAPMFGGIPITIETAWVTVIPEKDLTITYLPQ